MPSDDITVEGLDELARKMDALPPKLAARCARPALNAGAQVFENALLQTVPVDTGELADAIASKIHVAGNLEDMSAIVGPRYMGGHKFTSTDPGVRAKFLEFGTRKMSPRFWMRRAYDIGKDAAFNATVRVLQTMLDAIERL